MALSMFASFRGYVLASLLLTTVVVSHAVYMKRFFYRSVIFLVKSKFAILAVGNMGLVSFLLLWRLIQALFLGPLRFREVERLHIRARDAVIECCFAISLFREQFNKTFVALVLTLLLVKSLHWLTKDRIEFLEEQPLSPVRTHLRLVGLMSLLLVFDLFLVRRFATLTYHSRDRTMFVLFAFEFTVLVIELFSDIVRYAFLVIDTSMEGHWEEKGMFSFYIELLSDLCQLTVYVIFFIYVSVFYSFPYHIIRELYMTFHKFQRRCSDFLRYRRVVATMNDLFADATEEELAEGDRTCIICREEMQTAKKLACGHIFHARCLQSWLKRQLTCPTCRATIDVNGTGNRTDNSRNPDRNDAEARYQGMNNNNANINNNQGNNNNANANNPPALQNNQRPVNFGEAGARIVNFANQWWNQVMNDAGGGGRGAAGQNGAAGVAGAGGAGAGGAAGARTGTGVNGAGDVAGGAGAAQDVNERRLLQMNGRQFANYGVVGNAYWRGPDANALAHMQLRARRRGAWPHPFQPFQMDQNGPNQGGHGQALHHAGYPLNPFLQQQGRNHVEGNVGTEAPDNSGGHSQDRGNGSTAGETDSPRIEVGQQSQANEASSSREVSRALTGGASNCSSRSSSGSGGASKVIESLERSESQGGGRVVAHSVGGSGESVRGRLQGGDGRRGEASGGGEVGQADGQWGSNSDDMRGESIRLEKLLAIQEQIEVLRMEVIDLVLLATRSGPTGEVDVDAIRNRMESVSEQPGVQGEDSEMRSGAEVVVNGENDVGQDDIGEGGGGDVVAVDAGDAGRENEDNSEAGLLRRRRMAFLARNS